MKEWVLQKLRLFETGTFNLQINLNPDTDNVFVWEHAVH